MMRKTPRAVGLSRFQNYQNAYNVWSNLLEQLQPFPANATHESRDSRDVAAGTRQTLTDAAFGRIADIHKNNWYGARRMPQRHQGRRGDREDRVGFRRHHFRCVGAHAVDIAGGPTQFDTNVVAFRPA